MTIEAIKKLGYIYYMTKQNKKLRREFIKDIQQMGNYTLVLTENSGLIKFHKNSSSEVQDRIFYLNTGIIIREHKKFCNSEIKNLEHEQNSYKEKYVQIKKSIAELELEKARIYNDIQRYFSEDKEKLENFGRNEQIHSNF